MAIPFSKYISITSGVGGGAAVARKDLIVRIYTTNELVPPETVLEFTTLADVGIYFGTTSDEYLRSSFYFGYISKNIVKAQKISFYRYAKEAAKPAIFGGTSTKALGDFTVLGATADLKLSINGTTETIVVDLTAATSLSNVAELLQGAIVAKGGDFVGTTVEFNAVQKRFILKGSQAGDILIDVDAGDSKLASILEWLKPYAIIANGSEAQTLTSTLDKSIDLSTNFASFIFNSELTIEELEEVSDWTQNQNNQFMFCVPATVETAADISEALISKGGVIVTLIKDDYAEMIPAVLAATTDYNKRNSVINYMFNQFDLEPSVTTSMLSNTMDALRINYYGQTQTAGQNISFYQRGNMMGLATSPSAANVFVNEIWLKDAMGSQIMSLLLSLAKVSANQKGKSQIVATCQSVIEEALNNGVISVGKTLNNTQKLYVANMTGDDLAFITLENIGYWIDAKISEAVVNGVTEYSCDYTLLYCKDDTIRKVNGTHVLI